MTARLVLWDVDLTLIDARSIGVDWYRRALSEVTGVRLQHVPDMAGKTELAITGEVLAAHDVDTAADTVAAMFTALTTVVLADRDALSLRGNAMPGAAQALAALAEVPGVVQSLVTGNLPEVAFHKLDAFGLHRHVDFDIGGFGAESLHRHDLISTAVAKAAAKHDAEFAPESVIVVGDTPRDVAGALHHGAIAVGVASGRSDEQELRAAGAHVVLPDLTDTDAVLKAVAG
ncbi:haloacid dehalogenase-like hydrolase [Saccharopolyspora sp. NFXS83]|uniref:HAD family hydrolase n=1 Tax=Saccharopolyspora sp. NFXS83 TaxID=2993560 RepID=UPI00224B9EA7|nr:HAD hydrolase-like protein [Saccharopolyspora sp. NFXS83]MCX2732963.1 haloacid dehalogenase-like hydrolase [Saccharopolyspora sp. NFXS83]